MSDAGNWRDADRKVSRRLKQAEGRSSALRERHERVKRAAKQGDAKAQFSLGLLYHEGQGGDVDYAEARRWYLKAAEQGDAKAQCSLGLIYQHGLGVGVDYAEARRWFLLAVKQEDDVAQCQLGIFYEYGHGVGVDYAEARQWYERAAGQGNTRAQQALSLLEQKQIETSRQEEAVTHKPIEETEEKAQNEEVKPPLIQPDPFVPPDPTFDSAVEYFISQGVTEQNRPAAADIAARVVELDRRDPEAAKAIFAAVNNVLATGAAMPEASHAQRVTKSRRASVGQQEPTAPVHADIPPPPTEAPALYAERENKRQGVYAFVLDTYAPWIVPDPAGGPIPVLMLPRKLIEQLDPTCDQALTDWPGNHKGQPVPLTIARKGAAAPPPLIPEPLRDAWRSGSRTAYQKPRRANQAEGGRDR